MEPDRRRRVQEFYAGAATAPRAGLCCPKDYDEELVAHVPAEALEYRYGCGSPVARAGIRPDEVVLDLGAGVGVDCFAAARLVGSGGAVIGVDMTDEMVDKARRFQPEVAARLGYDVVEFRRGTIERLPVPDRSVDVVISNCVLNLSTRLEEVLGEIHRVLREGGRAVISDIVSDRPIAVETRGDDRLWAECYAGARPVGEFVGAFGAAGFVALRQLDEEPWEQVDGYSFASLTVSAHKFAGGGECRYAGQVAVYLGPYASVKDEEGHEFPRFVPVEVCTDTAARLGSEPYAGSFVVAGSGAGTASGRGCCEASEGSAAGCCEAPAGSASGCCDPP